MPDVLKPVAVSTPVLREDLVSKKVPVYHKMLVNGDFGVGKSYFAMTYPKWKYAMIEPHGIQTALTHPHLLANMVSYESFVPREDEDIKDTFSRLDQFLTSARKEAQEGKIQTVILDNLSHLTENRWMYIEKYERQLTEKGNVNTLAMFLGLSRWLYRFTIERLLTIPAHVIVTCHVMDEKEQDDRGISKKTGQIISDTLGNFRDKAPGLFNASLFLEVTPQPSPKPPVYRALCQPTGQRKAKNNLGLPMWIENISYDKILSTLNGHLGPTVPSAH